MCRLPSSRVVSPGIFVMQFLDIKRLKSRVCLMVQREFRIQDVEENLKNQSV